MHEGLLLLHASLGQPFGAYFSHRALHFAAILPPEATHKALPEAPYIASSSINEAIISLIITLLKI